MKRLHLLGLTCVCLGIAAMLLFRTGGLAIAASQSSCGSWNIVHMEKTTAGNSSLSGIATISSNDIWAVGGTSNSNDNSQTLTEHWNGTSWSIVPSPNVDELNDLKGVTAVSTNNVWAVGEAWTTGIIGQTLIEHWDGNSWSVIPSPNPSPPGQFAELDGVAAVSATDIWAVGQYLPDSYHIQALIEHWDGSQWSIILSTTNLINTHLDSITALSANNVWAVGYHSYNGVGEALVEHFDGSQWSIVRSANLFPVPPITESVYLYGVAAASANDIWAVGQYFNDIYDTDYPLIEHWNGTSWSAVPGAPIHSSSMVLYAVAAISATSAWAVGIRGGKTSIEHWNGATWNAVSNPNPDAINTLTAVANVPGSNYTWVVGYVSSGGLHPFAAYHC
jgi:hypothetical protein